MYTTCPRCETQLTVTVAGLRTGQGFVRCSRCSDVFNALLELAEDGDTTEQAAATGSRPALKQPEPTETPESEHVSTGTFHTIVLEGDAVLQTEEVVPETELDAQIKAITGHIESTPEVDTVEAPTFELDEGELDKVELEHATGPLTRHVGQDTTPETAPEPTVPAPEPVAAPVEREAPVATEQDAVALLGASNKPAAPGRGWPWKLLGLVVLLGVIITLVHVFRLPLVEQAWATKPLTAAYALLHIPLQPRWDLSAYEARQLGAEAADGTPPRIIVRASIHNHALKAQPAPLLRVALQDRFGLQLTTRVVAPEEYLRDGSPTELGPDQRRDVSFTLPDPGQGAVGFEIDACLRDAGGALRCSSDPQIPR